jgi:hypothetical protein
VLCLTWRQGASDAEKRRRNNRGGIRIGGLGLVGDDSLQPVPYADPDADQHADVGADLHQDANGYSDAHQDSHANLDSRANSDFHADARATPCQCGIAMRVGLHCAGQRRRAGRADLDDAEPAIRG